MEQFLPTLVGRDGRDGEPGPCVIPGRDGKVGLQEEKGDMGEQGPPGPSSGGVTYVRWGRTTCPNTTGTELVYKRRAAGTFYSHPSGSSNYQCMTESPQNFDVGLGTASENSFIYGAEYQIWGNNVPSSSKAWHDHDVPCAVYDNQESIKTLQPRNHHLRIQFRGRNDHDVPCTVCYVAPRETVPMIPGT